MSTKSVHTFRISKQKAYVPFLPQATYAFSLFYSFSYRPFFFAIASVNSVLISVTDFCAAFSLSKASA